MGAHNSHPTYFKRHETDLTEEEIELLGKHTHFTHEEIKILHSKFIKEYPKGKIKQKQFNMIYQKYYPLGNVNRFCKYAFKYHDKDGSGQIDFIEYLIFISVILRGDLNEKLKMAFDVFDVDRNGNVDGEELKTFIDIIYEMFSNCPTYGEKSLTNAYKIIEKLDKDKNGVISCQEFIDVLIEDSGLRKLFVPLSNRLVF